MSAWIDLAEASPEEFKNLTALYFREIAKMNKGIHSLTEIYQYAAKDNSSAVRNMAAILYSCLKKMEGGRWKPSKSATAETLFALAGEHWESFLFEENAYVRYTIIDHKRTFFGGSEVHRHVDDLKNLGIDRWPHERKMNLIKKLMVLHKDQPLDNRRYYFAYRALQFMTLTETIPADVDISYLGKFYTISYVQDGRTKYTDKGLTTKPLKKEDEEALANVALYAPPTEVPLLLPHEAFFHYAQQYIHAEGGDDYSPEDIKALNTIVRDGERIRYGGSLPLDLKERVYLLTPGDYLAYRKMPMDAAATGSTGSIDKLVHYFNRSWVVPCDLKDAVTHRALKGKKISLNELLSLRRHIKYPERFMDVIIDTYKTWKEGIDKNDKEENSLKVKIKIITALVPPGPDRKRMIMDESLEHTLGWKDYQLMKKALEEDVTEDRDRMYADQEFMREMKDFSAQDRSDLLLWSLNLSQTLPPSVRFKMVKEWKVTKENLKDYLKLPSVRDMFFENLMISPEGLLLDNQKYAMNQLVDRIWNHLFGPKTKWDKMTRFANEALKIVFKHADAHKKYDIFGKICQLLYKANQDGKKVGVNDLIQTALGAYGPEGAKLGQILSSLQSVWDAEPELAKLLSDFQDQSSLISHYDAFQSLEQANGPNSAENIRIAAPSKAGSIKAFFVAEDKKTSRIYGLLHVRPQVIKDLDASEESMKSIVGELEPLVRSTFGGDIPVRIVEIVFHMIRREVYLHHEKNVVKHLATKSLAFRFPRQEHIPGLSAEIDHQLTIEMLHPHVSLKDLLILEKDAVEWSKLSRGKKKLIASLMGHRRLDLTYGEFCEWMNVRIKPSMRELYTKMREEEEYVHVDPHGGNVLIVLKKDESGHASAPIHLIDLGAMLKFSPQVRELESSLYLGLFTADQAALNQGLSRFAGREANLDWSGVLAKPMKQRLFDALQLMEKNGFRIPLDIHEYFLSLPKADQWLFEA